MMVGLSKGPLLHIHPRVFTELLLHVRARLSSITRANYRPSHVASGRGRVACELAGTIVCGRSRSEREARWKFWRERSLSASHHVPYKLGSTAVGVKTNEGVVLAVEKRITSPLLEPSSVEKIMEIDEHIACAMSGLTADARTLIDHGRVETQNHRFTYNEPMTVESCTQSLCDLALRFGEGDDDAMSRPFGVALLIAGYDENGPCLFHTDPSGTFVKYEAKAIGSGSEGAQSSLQEHFNKDMTLKEAETLALSTLKQVMEEKVSATNVDIASVAPKFHLYSAQEVEAVIARL
ncbi:hypothetical protein CBR_g4752 [Chara braunii]|uniref:Proteasome alpha-type subunits domain-containing protein n=1 Tax=Chara braunii TaxID=69332 RepID=A0A388KIR5_CHABU|nr:hypothetical protein CBR_g4752 [Chara braunii]|eukprot:GBG69926.1 hypothetical protein CBR_g4752 [Chara braunii]